MKHLKVCQKYSAVCSIFNSLLSVSPGNETLLLMLDILHQMPTKRNTCKYAFTQCNIEFRYNSQQKICTIRGLVILPQVILLILTY